MVILCVFFKNSSELILTINTGYIMNFIVIPIYKLFTLEDLTFIIQNCGSKFI
jgi:long-subunit acyl-CoA synthetase (AMP-forming)